MYKSEWRKKKDEEEDLFYQLKKIFYNLQHLHVGEYFNPVFFQAFKNN